MASDGSELHGEEPVIRETDRQLGNFYHALRKSGFFERGILFVTGDHRAMEPFQAAEMERFGTTARARIPAIIVSDALPQKRLIDEDFQQRDLSASVLSVVADQYCPDVFQGSFMLDIPTPSRCILHARGDDRDLVFVKCGSRTGTVMIAGDQTRFIEGDVDASDEVIDAINLQRLRVK